MVSPSDAVANLKALREAGLAGRLGYYEAIDYTEERLPKNHRGGLVLPTYMAHHQGMSLLALGEVLNGSPMQRRFHADSRIQAADLLLQERIPHLVPLKNPPIEKAEHIPSTRQLPAPLVAALHLATHAQSAHASPLEWRLRRDGHQRRRRLQPSPGAGDDPMAGRSDSRRSGAPSVTCAISKPVMCGRRRSSRRGKSRICMKRLSRPIGRCSAVSTSTSSSGRKSWCRLKTRRSCGASRSPTTARALAVSTSRATPRSFSPRSVRTWRIRHSVICSSRRSPFPNAMHSCASGVHAKAAIGRI